MNQRDLTRIIRASRNGVIFDTNLLIILLVGLYRKEEISRFLTAKCLETDFDIIRSLIIKYNLTCTVTPQILAEVSNLTFDHFKEPGLKEYLQKTISYIAIASEEYVTKESLTDKYHLPMLGYCDSSIIEASKLKGYLVVTEDIKLYGTLMREGCPAININHIRSMALLR